MVIRDTPITPAAIKARMFSARDGLDSDLAILQA
jgi:hypothetical protein